MRDPLTNPPTSFTLREREAPEGLTASKPKGAEPPALHRGQNPAPQRCYLLLHAAPAFPSRLPLLSRSPLFGSAPTSNLQPLTSRIDRYTYRSKIAVSPSPSSKVPNLIDTLFDSAASRCLHLRSSCTTARFEILPVSNLQFLTSGTCYVVLRNPRTRQNISAPLPRDFRRNSNAINKTAKISRHVFGHFAKEVLSTDQSQLGGTTWVWQARIRGRRWRRCALSTGRA